MRRTYWLIREVGKTIGTGTVAANAASTADEALRCFDEELDPYFKELFKLYNMEFEAVLVTLSYVDGQPVVTPVESAL